MRISVPQPNASNPTPAPTPGPATNLEARIDEIGQPVWNIKEIADGLRDFLTFHETRPIRTNDGGMKSSGLFTLWNILKKTQPTLVVESGVWKGQSTWLIENALPKAHIFAIDPAAEGILYRTPRAEYTTQDFLTFDWKSLGDHLAQTLVFFDDHQDVFPRLRLCRDLGIKTVILDDNYPEYCGNRHISTAAILNQKFDNGSFRFAEERKFLLENIASYHMFPPIFDYREEVTMGKSFITVPSVMGAYDPIRHAGLEQYWQEASSYRWTSLIRFK